jgi:hypothetical protein
MIRASRLPVLLGVLAGCVVIVAATAKAAPAATGPGTIRIIDVQTAVTWVYRPHGRGAGDLEIIAQALYNQRISLGRIGRANILCTLLRSTRRSCTATYVLPRGRIVTSGVIDNQLFYELAIIGAPSSTTTREGRSSSRRRR